MLGEARQGGSWREGVEFVECRVSAFQISGSFLRVCGATVDEGDACGLKVDSVCSCREAS
jgi:hypothetical protein